MSRGDGVIGIEKLHDGVVHGLAVNMVACWVSARSAEMVVDEVAEEFDGMDPLKALGTQAARRVQGVAA